eukprot:TRINITY_DN1360_c0_g2_i1.p1 TRINITY_DN1360_c0_g2~~TRINITY_DN1360_c0_g2_i1.p1  ORF type:complete len:957 (+),score=213.93 TRINITY_DN1360_c0_g2_i1:76-2946(+)
MNLGAAAPAAAMRHSSPYPAHQQGLQPVTAALRTVSLTESGPATPLNHSFSGPSGGLSGGPSVGPTGSVVAVWGKSGEQLVLRDAAISIDGLREAALDELRSNTAGASPARHRLVVLDHLGNPPRGGESAAQYRHLFLFALPSKDSSGMLPDVLPLESPCEHPPQQPHVPPVPELPLPAGRAAEVAELAGVRGQLHARAVRCRGLAEEALRRADFCADWLQAMQLQAKGRDAVCAQLGQLNSKVTDGFAELKRRVTASGAEFDDLLRTFDRDLQRLSETPVHPSLRTPGVETLLDCLHADPVAWKDSCHLRWQGIQAKLAEFDVELDKMGRNVMECCNRVPADVDYEQLDSAPRDWQSAAAELRDIELEAERWLTQVTDRLASIARRQVAGADGAAELLGHGRLSLILEEQQRREAAATARVRELCQVCAACGEARRRMQHFMSRYVDRAVQLTNEVIRLQRRASAYSAGFTGRDGAPGLEDYFRQLRIVRNMPEAYKWGLVELSRRGMHRKRLQQWLSKCSHVLNAANREEMARRAEWPRRYGGMLPEGVLDALREPSLDPLPNLVLPPPVDPPHQLRPPYDTPESVIALYDALPGARDLIGPPELLRSMLAPCSLEDGGMPPMPPLPAAPPEQQQQQQQHGDGDTAGTASPAQSPELSALLGVPQRISPHPAGHAAAGVGSASGPSGCSQVVSASSAVSTSAGGAEEEVAAPPAAAAPAAEAAQAPGDAAATAASAALAAKEAELLQLREQVEQLQQKLAVMASAAASTVPCTDPAESPKEGPAADSGGATEQAPDSQAPGAGPAPAEGGAAVDAAAVLGALGVPSADPAQWAGRLLLFHPAAPRPGEEHDSDGEGGPSKDEDALLRYDRCVVHLPGSSGGGATAVVPAPGCCSISPGSIGSAPPPPHIVARVLRARRVSVGEEEDLAEQEQRMGLSGEYFQVTTEVVWPPSAE